MTFDLALTLTLTLKLGEEVRLEEPLTLTLTFDIWVLLTLLEQRVNDFNTQLLLLSLTQAIAKLLLSPKLIPS